MKYSLTLFFSLLLLSPITFAQASFQKTFAIGTYDQANCIRQTDDGGYIIAGFAGDYPSDLNASLIRTNASGDTLWTRTFGGTGLDYAQSVTQTADGGFILCGRTDSLGIPPQDIYVVKTDENGNVLWSKTYDEGTYDFGNSVQQTNDGGYIITGIVRPQGLFQPAITLIRTDSYGNILWSNIYDENFLYYEEAWSVKQTSDGGFIIGGDVENSAALIKTDSSGNVEWSKYYSSGSTGRFYDVQQTSDGGYIGVGYFFPGDFLLLVKTNSEGDTLWVKTYDHGIHDVAYSVEQTADHGYIISGSTNNNGDQDACMIKTDSLGIIQWSMSYDLPASTGTAFSARETSDGGYVFAGETAFADYKIYFVKTDSNGNSFCNDSAVDFVPTSHLVNVTSPVFSISSNITDSSVTFITGSGAVDSTYCSIATTIQFENDKEVSIFPNPFSQFTTINFLGEEKYSLLVFDVFGKKVMKAENNSGPYTMERGSLTTGIYFFQITAKGKEIASGKVIAE